MNGIVVGCLLFICAMPFGAVASAADYWPTDTRRTYYFAATDGDSASIAFRGQYFTISYSRNGVPTCEVTRIAEPAANGNVLIKYDSGYCAGAIDPDYIWTYDPPVTFIDLPLDVGKVWQQGTTATGYGVQPIGFVHSVSSSESVTVPYGTFDVVVLEEGSSDSFRTATYHLDKDIGPVMLEGRYKLVGIDYTVRTTTSTWGGIKGHFR
jgi:hypothetical protein